MNLGALTVQNLVNCYVTEGCRECYEKSFASHEKSKYWSPKNEIEPRQVLKQTRDKYIFDCTTCSHEFRKRIDKIYKDSWCPFCANKKLCSSIECKVCFEKSFESHEKSKFWSKDNLVSPRDVIKFTREKYKFDCRCGHSFKKTLSDVSYGGFCPYCTHQKLCDRECNDCFNNSFASVVDKSKYWSRKNQETPREVFKNTHKKYLFNCKKKHEFEMRLSHVSRGCWCPLCTKKSEAKLLKYLERYPHVDYQVRFNWCRNEKGNCLPFDFVVWNYAAIVELDGPQHHRQVSNWQSPEKTQLIDRYKAQKANEMLFAVIRLSQEEVWEDNTDWRERLHQALEDYTKPEEIFLY